MAGGGPAAIRREAANDASEVLLVDLAVAHQHGEALCEGLAARQNHDARDWSIEAMKCCIECKRTVRRCRSVERQRWRYDT